MCELCHKKCKSKSGLKRHKTVKHKETSAVAENQKGGGQESCLTLVAYSRIVEKAKHKIIDNKIYPKSIRDELSSYTYNNGLQDLTAEFCDIEDLYKRLMKSGNAERFYSSFYSSIVPSTNYGSNRICEIESSNTVLNYEMNKYHPRNQSPAAYLRAQSWSIVVLIKF